MAHIDTQALLEPLGPDDACGEELEYDPLFTRMEEAAAGKADQQVGDATIEGEEPQWGQVMELGLELFARTRDLRVAVYLCRALAATEGVSGVLDGLTLLDGLIERYWAEVHPRLDPDDDNDPTQRLNAIGSLASPDTVPRSLREAPLVRLPQFGAFSLRDLEIARGELTVPEEEGEERPDLALIEGGVAACDDDYVHTLHGEAAACVERVRAIESRLAGEVGAGQTPDLELLTKTLEGIEGVFAQQLATRGIDATPGADSGAEAATEEGEDAMEATGAQAGPRNAGGVHSRTDVLRALDEICRYYEANEPSSPIPLLLRRVRGLVTMNFVELVRDIAPEGMGQVEALLGNQQEYE